MSNSDIHYFKLFTNTTFSTSTRPCTHLVFNKFLESFLFDLCVIVLNQCTVATEPLDVQATVRKSANVSSHVNIELRWRQPSRCNGVVTSYTIHWSITDSPDVTWSSKVVNGMLDILCELLLLLMCVVVILIVSVASCGRDAFVSIVSRAPCGRDTVALIVSLAPCGRD